ncbi:NAD-dependent deacylase [Corynebacterium epidermidicanis]|uniref:NAD-dependent protein deacylase n=1 Tax=Corynebacterium epidermidicanis TaxID=1050174 RepID=A0A0G3GTU0_9CORY|nr:NAD-dependent deacylase [Corynebacterium epidermidicanis]AKK02973.1 NAD-dependent protein deacetylase, SIR2 family [Corynebacterium epidermidicanis]
MVPEEVTSLLADARRVVAFTGAGMSAESGLDTYRDATTGLWENVDPQAMASIDAWARDPDPMWAWYLWRARLAAEAQPNAGHRALAPIPIVTQNIDNLHERGGSVEVVHLHGSLFSFRCTICARPFRGVELPESPAERATPPACPLCGNLIRPGVVWFGEMLPTDAWQRAEDLISSCDALLVVGTSGIVQPAATLPLLAPAMIEISPQETNLTRFASYSWRTTAAVGLPQLESFLTTPS